METSTNVVIVGAGPIGIACGIEASCRGIAALLIDKGCLTNTIFRYPPQLVFFSAPQLLELGSVPFITGGSKPTRAEVLAYYRRLTEFFELKVQLFERVEEIRADGDTSYLIRTAKGRALKAKYVVLAVGFYDHPNLLGVPGEELPKVSHYYMEPHPFYRQKVVVIGAQNSAAEAALELQRHGAEVTLLCRGSSLGDGIKYWVRPDLENRIKEGSIEALFSTEVERIDHDAVVARGPDGKSRRIPNDFVFALTGYHTDLDFLRDMGIVFDPDSYKPLFDPSTMETNLPGVYIAGVAAGGRDGGKLFIENTRYHAKLIFQDIERKIELEEDSSDS